MPTITERLELLVDAKTGGAISEIRKLNASVDQTATATTKTGTASGFLASKMEALGLSSQQASTVLKTAVPVAAGVAGAALLKFGQDAVATTLKYTSTVRDLQRVTGTTAETASRLVAVFDDLEISQEAAAKGFFKLSREIGAGRSDLEDFGIKTKDASGHTRDLEQILLDVADKYTKMSDEGRKAQLVQEAFGRGGQELLPILEKGRAGIEQLFKDVPQGQIFNQEQLDNARKYELAVDDLKDSLDEFKIQIGTALIPTLTQLASTLAQVSRAAQMISAPFGGLGQVIGGLIEQSNPLTAGLHAVTGAQHLWNGEIRQGSEDLVRSVPFVGNMAAGIGTLTGLFKKGSDSANEYSDTQKKLAEAQQKVADLAAAHKTNTEEGVKAQRELTAAQNEADGAARRVANALDDAASKTKENETATSNLAYAIGTATAAQRAYYDATLASINASLGLTGAELNVEAAIKSAADATKENGAASLEARQAQQSLEESVLAAADAAAKANKEQLALYGVTQTTTDAVQAQRDELNRLKERFPELTPVIDAYLWKLGEIPPVKVTTVYLMTDDAMSRAAAMKAQIDALPADVRIDFYSSTYGTPGPSRQHGGPIPGGVNDPFPVIAHGGEYVLSADVVSRIKRGAPSYGANTGAGVNAAGGGGGPQVIQLVVSGRVLAEVTAAEFSRLGGPQMAARAIQN